MSDKEINMTKKTKLQLPSMRTKTDDDTSIFSNKMWTQPFDELMKNIDDPDTTIEIVSIDVGDKVRVQTTNFDFICTVSKIDEDFNLITVIHDDTGTEYIWDETPDTRILESSANTEGIRNIFTITNIDKIIGDDHGTVE